MTLTAVHCDDGVVVLRAEGELDVLAAPGLLADLPALVQGAPAVVLDLTDITFFDSSGVRLVDRLLRACHSAGATLRVVSPRDSLSRRVLEIVGLADSLADDDLAVALERVRAT